MKLAILSLSAALAFGQSVKQNTPITIIGPLTLSSGAGTSECLQRNTSGVVSGTGVACGVGSGATGPTGPTGSNGTNGAPGATGATGAGLTDCSETSGTMNCPGGFGATGAPASGAAYFGGVTSGGEGFVVADVAGVNKLFLVLPATTASTGQALVDGGSTACPTMPSSMPASPSCRLLTWATLAVTVASGTSALGTSAISANSCATVVTTSAPGVVSTDTVTWAPNVDISGVTGYGAASTDGLKVYPYPTTGNVNWRVCNGSGTSQTPGPVTLNWRVGR